MPFGISTRSEALFTGTLSSIDTVLVPALTCQRVYSDIKPENLLFNAIPYIPSKVNKARPYDEEKEDEGEFTPGVGGGGIGVVKLADFGLSKVVWDQDTMTPCGTVGYTAPEIVKDERYSKAVDMWALGCVLYTLLCGFPPFYDVRAAQRAHRSSIIAHLVVLLQESINVLTEKVAKGYYTFLFVCIPASARLSAKTSAFQATMVGRHQCIIERPHHTSLMCRPGRALHHR